MVMTNVKTSHITRHSLDSDLFTGDLTIPSHQRPFEWKATEQVRDLVEDLLHASTLDHDHFFGTFYIQYPGAHHGGMPFVQDGQQRVTAIKCLDVAESICREIFGTIGGKSNKGLLTWGTCQVAFEKYHESISKLLPKIEDCWRDFETSKLLAENEAKEASDKKKWPNKQGKRKDKNNSVYLKEVDEIKKSKLALTKRQRDESITSIKREAELLKKEDFWPLYESVFEGELKWLWLKSQPEDWAERKVLMQAKEWSILETSLKLWNSHFDKFKQYSRARDHALEEITYENADVGEIAHEAREKVFQKLNQTGSVVEVYKYLFKSDLSDKEKARGDVFAKLKMSPTDVNSTMQKRICDAIMFFATSMIVEVAVDVFKNNDKPGADSKLREGLSKFYAFEFKLEKEDDPNVFFNLINARGKPLNPWDVIRNSLIVKLRTESLESYSYIVRKLSVTNVDYPRVKGHQEDVEGLVIDLTCRVLNPSNASMSAHDLASHVERRAGAYNLKLFDSLVRTMSDSICRIAAGDEWELVKCLNLDTLTLGPACVCAAHDDCDITVVQKLSFIFWKVYRFGGKRITSGRAVIFKWVQEFFDPKSGEFRQSSDLHGALGNLYKELQKDLSNEKKSKVNFTKVSGNIIDAYTHKIFGKWFLFAYERALNGNMKPNLQIEHIFAKSNKDLSGTEFNWKVSKSAHSRPNINHLGNLVLLGAATNKGFSNKNLHDKRDILKEKTGNIETTKQADEVFSDEGKYFYEDQKHWLFSNKKMPKKDSVSLVKVDDTNNDDFPESFHFAEERAKEMLEKVADWCNEIHEDLLRSR